MDQTEKTLQEKLARVERLEERFSSSFMTVQAIDARFSKLEKEIEALQNSLCSVDKSIKTVARRVEETVCDIIELESASMSFASKFDQQKPLHDKHIEKYSVIDRIESSQKDQAKLIEKLDQKQSEFATKAGLDDCRYIAKRSNDDLQQCLNNTEAQLQTVQAALKKAIEAQSVSEKNISSLKTEQSGLVAVCNTSIAAINEIKSSFTKRLIDVELDLAKKITQEIEQRVPAVDPQKISIVVKEMIKVDLANISVDATNAYLKYNNLDSQVKLLEKKIETLSLLIKKAEISKQT